MIFPQTPKYEGQGTACPTPVRSLAFALSLLGSVFPRTPSYASAPPDEPTEHEADDDMRRVVVHADQVPQPLRDLLRRLFAQHD